MRTAEHAKHGDKERLYERLTGGIFLELSLRHDDLDTARKIMPHTSWSLYHDGAWEQVEFYFAWIAYANRYREDLVASHWRASDHGIADMQWTPDGKELIHISNYDGRVKAWRIEPGEKPVGGQIYGITHRGYSAAVDRNKRFALLGAVTSRGFQLNIHDIQDKRQLGQFGPKGSDFMGAVASPDGQSFATTSLDGTINIVKFADPDSFRAINAINHAISMAFSPDSKSLATYHYDGSAVIWDLVDVSAKGNGILKPRMDMTQDGSICWSPSGRFVAIGNERGELKCYDRQKPALYELLYTPMRVSSLEFSPDEKYIFAGCRNGHIKMFDYVKNESVLTLTGHWSEVRHVKVSPDATTLASGTIDGIIALWEMDHILKGAKAQASD